MGDGRRMQWSKHFIEPLEWVTKPGQTALNKLGYPVKEVLNQVMGTEYLAPHQDVRTGSVVAGPAMEDSRLGHALQGINPIAVQQAFGASGGAGLAGALGAPIYGKTAEERREYLREQRRRAIKRRVDAMLEGRR